MEGRKRRDKETAQVGKGGEEREEDNAGEGEKEVALQWANNNCLGSNLRISNFTSLRLKYLFAQWK